MSLAAGQMGIRAGMRLAEAQARCATLAVRPWDDTVVRDALLEATTGFLTASPQVTPVHGTPGMWWIGASGFTALGGEPALHHALLARARSWHPAARVAIADSCIAARIATWTTATPAGDGGIIIPSGHDATYLAPAPLSLLPMPTPMREALAALGLRTIGTLAALPPGDVEARWGADGVTAWRLAHGDDPRRPGLVRVEAPRTASVELPAPVDRAAPLCFVLRAQLERVLQDVVTAGRAAAAAAITLHLDAGRDRRITREVRPARPLARLEPLFDQCRAQLEQWRLPAPVIGLTIGIPATAPLAADQGDLLVPSWRDAAMTADAVFTKLRVALDPAHHGDVVVRPAAGTGHTPEASGHWRPADAHAQAAAPVPQGADTPDPPLTGTLRLLEHAEAVPVDTSTDGTPGTVWWRGRPWTVAHADGPERLSGDWWRTTPYAREYWRCTVPEESTLLIYRDAATWYLHGWYD